MYSFAYDNYMLRFQFVLSDQSFCNSGGLFDGTVLEYCSICYSRLEIIYASPSDSPRLLGAYGVL